MEMTGEQKLPLRRQDVWNALNDPAVLKRCLPGCDVFEPDGDRRFKVGMLASVGPVKARFSGRLTLTDWQPPHSYVLGFEGSGGAAGFAKGRASVRLEEEGGGEATVLVYSVTAQVGGRLAQVGSRLIDGVAARMASEFFTRFAREVHRPGDSGGVEATRTSAAVAEPPPAASLDQETKSPAVPLPSEPRKPEGDELSRHVAVLAAAISAIGAALAVLGAAVALYAAR